MHVEGIGGTCSKIQAHSLWRENNLQKEMMAVVRGNSWKTEQGLLSGSEEGTEWESRSISSRGSFIDKHPGDGSLYLQDPSPWLQ